MVVQNERLIDCGWLFLLCFIIVGLSFTTEEIVQEVKLIYELLQGYLL